MSTQIHQMKNKTEKEEERPEYWVRNALSKFGFEIMKRTPEFTRVFHTSDKEQAKKALSDFQQKGYTQIIPLEDWQPNYLMLKEKHGSPLYLIRNEQELFSLALRIVQSRKEDGYYFFEEDDKYYYKPVTDEEIAAIKNQKVLEFALEQKRLHNEELKEKKNDSYQRNLLNQAIQDNDGHIAWMLMKERQGYEYEKFEYDDFSLL